MTRSFVEDEVSEVVKRYFNRDISLSSYDLVLSSFPYTSIKSKDGSHGFLFVGSADGNSSFGQRRGYFDDLTKTVISDYEEKGNNIELEFYERERGVAGFSWRKA